MHVCITEHVQDNELDGARARGGRHKDAPTICAAHCVYKGAVDVHLGTQIVFFITDSSE